MLEMFKKRLNKMFFACPKSKAADDLKEEILGVLMDKYEENINLGYDELTASKLAMKSAKDFSPLIQDLRRDFFLSKKVEKLKRFLLITIAYYLGLVAAFLTVSFITHGWRWTWSIIVGGTFLYIVGANAVSFMFARARKKYWLGIINIWLMIFVGTTGIYMLVSFLTKMWSVTWLAFIAALLVSYICTMIYTWHIDSSKMRKFNFVMIAIISCVFVYLTVSMLTHIWSISWLIFVFLIFAISLFILIDEIEGPKQKEKREREETAENGETVIAKEKIENAEASDDIDSLNNIEK